MMIHQRYGPMCHSATPVVITTADMPDLTGRRCARNSPVPGRSLAQMRRGMRSDGFAAMQRGLFVWYGRFRKVTRVSSTTFTWSVSC